MNVTPGTCRYCHCTLSNPCKVYPFEDGDTCGWMPKTNQTVCTRKECAIAWDRFCRAERARKQAERIARRVTPADMHDIICGRKPRHKKEAAA